MSLFEIILVTPLIFGVICIILGFLYYGLMYIGISLYILHFPFKWTVKLLNKIFKKKSEIRKEKIKNQMRAELKFNIKIPQEEGAVAHNLKIILYFYPGLC
jgi:hypothetical protein